MALGVRIDVNLASAADLQAIPGVGPSTAAAIVARRDLQGPFADIAHLERVRGIGPARLAAIRPFVRAGPGNW
jgi:competence protein ComEA